MCRHLENELNGDLQAVVNIVKNWTDEWLLRLNVDKCKTVSYIC